MHSDIYNEEHYAQSARTQFETIGIEKGTKVIVLKTVVQKLGEVGLVNLTYVRIAKGGNLSMKGWMNQNFLLESNEVLSADEAEKLARIDKTKIRVCKVNTLCFPYSEGKVDDKEMNAILKMLLNPNYVVDTGRLKEMGYKVVWFPKGTEFEVVKDVDPKDSTQPKKSFVRILSGVYENGSGWVCTELLQEKK